MTDGLEICEKRLTEISKNKDSRIDSQFWATAIKHNPNYIYTKIGNILKQSQYGLSLEMNEDGIGSPIYRMNEIHNSLCDLKVKKFADITEHELDVFKLHNGDVLFNRTNSYEWVGRTGIYYKESEQDKTVFASYLVRLVPDSEKVLPEYLTAFLNTTIGIRQIKARARQSVNQTNVNPEEVKEIEIPLLSMRLQTVIRNAYQCAHAKLVDSQQAYCSAEKLLEDYLNIQFDSDSTYSVKALSKSFTQSGRLDAEYYQPKYERLLSQLNNCQLYILNVSYMMAIIIPI